VLAGVVSASTTSPYGSFSIDMPAFPAQFKGKDVRDPFKLGEDIDAGLARHDHDVERRSARFATPRDEWPARCSRRPRPTSRDRSRAAVARTARRSRRHCSAWWRSSRKVRQGV
jgi:hypothetical protein